MIKNVQLKDNIIYQMIQQNLKEDYDWKGM